MAEQTKTSDSCLYARVEIEGTSFRFACISWCARHNRPYAACDALRAEEKAALAKVVG